MPWIKVRMRAPGGAEIETSIMADLDTRDRDKGPLLSTGFR